MVSFLLILFTSFFFTGIVIRTKSIASGRKGPGIMQPMKDIIRLLRKSSVFSDTTSIIFKIAPTIYFASVIMALMLIPLGHYRGILSFKGDFVFFAYILALGKFFNIISALDTGSSFEGMGSSREALFSMLAEPAFFLVMGSLSLLTGYTSFHDIFQTFHFGSYISYALGIMATFVLVMICMVENSRMPVDDPKTHLELTMIHEVMVLDNSGFDLGLIMQTVNLKFALYGALIANLYMGDLPFEFSIPIFLIMQILFAVVVGLLESFTARYRMSHNAQFIFTLASVSLLIFFAAMLILGKLY
jgi:formate hydrogenlyase subunit 4